MTSSRIIANPSFVFKTRFSAAHFYRNKLWTDEKNKEFFGLCHSTHGHNYLCEWWFEASSETRSTICEVLDQIGFEWEHKHLNDLEEFRNKIPTTETIAQVLWKKGHTQGVPLLGLRVHESDFLYSEILSEGRVWL